MNESKQLTMGEVFNRLASLIQAGMFDPDLGIDIVLNDKSFKALMEEAKPERKVRIRK